MNLPEPYYQDDAVTIYHGGCYEIAPLIEGVDALITDPPYGTGINFKYRRAAKFGVAVKDAPTQIVGDHERFDPAPWLEYPIVALWGANYFADRLPATSGWLVWDKREHFPSNDQSDCELAWTNRDVAMRKFSHLWKGFQRASEKGEGISENRSLHPTQKPVALMRWCVEMLTKPNDLILDPFMGSGPIARAAKDLGRRYVGIEIEEQYVKAAVARCRQEVLL